MRLLISNFSWQQTNSIEKHKKRENQFIRAQTNEHEWENSKSGMALGGRHEQKEIVRINSLSPTLSMYQQ